MTRLDLVDLASLGAVSALRNGDVVSRCGEGNEGRTGVCWGAFGSCIVGSRFEVEAPFVA